MLTLATDYDAYYTSTVHVSITINTPRIYERVIQLCMSLVSQRTRDIAKVFGMDKGVWTAELLKNIAPNQLPTAYGGAGNFSIWQRPK